MTTPHPKIQQLAAVASQWLEKTGLKSRLDPQLARFRAMDAEKKKQTMTGLVFAVVAANLLLVMAPLSAAFFDIHQKIQKTSSELSLANKDIASKDHLIKTLASAKEALALTEKRISKSDEVHQFLDVLSVMAKESKIKIESLTPVPVKGKPEELPRPLPRGYSLAGFELSGQAGYHELGQFIARLESGSPFVKVDAVDIYHEMSDSRRTHQIKLRFLLIRRD